MAKPEYAIREVSLAEVILFLLSVIILAAYHFDYRVATYIIFLDIFCRLSDNGKKIFETAVFLSGKTG